MSKAAPAPSSSQPQPLQRCSRPVASRPSTIIPVPLISTMPAPSGNAPRNAVRSSPVARQPAPWQLSAPSRAGPTKRSADPCSVLDAAGSDHGRRRMTPRETGILPTWRCVGWSRWQTTVHHRGHRDGRRRGRVPRPTQVQTLAVPATSRQRQVVCPASKPASGSWSHACVSSGLRWPGRTSRRAALPGGRRSCRWLPCISRPAMAARLAMEGQRHLAHAHELLANRVRWLVPDPNVDDQARECRFLPGFPGKGVGTERVEFAVDTADRCC